MLTRWEFIFTQLCAWRLHPGYTREGTPVPSFVEIMGMADCIEKLCEVKSCQQCGEQSAPLQSEQRAI